MELILLVIIVLLLVGAAPVRPHSRQRGYHPSGGLGLYSSRRGMAGFSRDLPRVPSGTARLGEAVDFRQNVSNLARDEYNPHYSRVLPVVAERFLIQFV
jgi:hypothetical protein